MRLLLAEDEPMLSDALTASLGRAGFDVEVAANSAVAEYLLLRHPFDVVVLDLGLPMVDGLTVVRRVRAVKPALSVMVLTALDGLDDRVAGLNAGADDYLTKPFDFPELEARLRALLRRSRVGDSALLDAGALTVDRDARRVTLHGEALDLSPREWQLLELLLTQRDKVVTKDQIAQAWGGDGTGDAGSGASSIEVYIHRLRRKLDQSGLAIRTVRGLGYLLETAPA
jgi:two-component system OmpR family response regulator